MILYRLLLFFYFSLIFPFQYIFSKRTRKFFKIRLKARTPQLSHSPSYLFHASSGEAEYNLPLIRQIKHQDPQAHIVVTFFSDSYIKTLSSIKDIDTLIPLPLDLPSSTRSLLKAIRPQCIFIARTDLWPEFLHQAQLMKIPTVLFSRTQPPISRTLAPIFKWLYSKVHLISCVTEDDAQNIKKSYPQKTKPEIKIHGDLRWDQTLYNLKQKPSFKYSKPSFVWGSIWPEDFKFLAPLWKKEWGLLIIVPHDPQPHFIRSIQKFFSHDFKINTYSELSSQDNPLASTNLDIVIVDTLGLLSRFYKNAYGAFIGGSFKKKVHSVMEALVAQTPVIVGPYNKNNREAQVFKNVQISPTLQAVNEVSKKSELPKLMEELFKTSSTKISFSHPKDLTSKFIKDMKIWGYIK